MTSKQSIISLGNTYYVYDDSVKLHDRMPVGTYRINFSPMSGHSIEKVDDLTRPGEKMYGRGEKRIASVLAGYRCMERSYGVLASGSGGMGKTMLMRSLAVAASQEFDLPIFLIDSPSPGLAQYIGKLGPAIVFFDEFEKIFDSSSEDGDQQVQFLSLFDGLGAHKQMYLATVNDLSRVNAYMVNRTGRFHKHLRFDFPEPTEVREYLADHGVEPSEAEKVVTFSTRVPLNYDHLRAIAFELAQVGESFEDAIADLNIKRMDLPVYQVMATFEKDRLKSSMRIDLFGADECESWFESSQHVVRMSFLSSDVVDDPRTGRMTVPVDRVTTRIDKEDEETLGKLLEVVVSTRPAKAIDYGA